MNMSFRRGATAALVLAVALTCSPLAFAASRNERDSGIANPIVRFIKKIQKIFHVAPLEDGLNPPKP
jgi:hypothetical protein